VPLQQAEAVRVDRPNEQACQPVELRAPEPLLRSPRDPLLELIRGPLGEGERDNRLGWQLVRE